MRPGLPDELKFLQNRRVPVKATTESLSGKVCVISGGTSGVGLAAARRIARDGAALVLLARNPAKATEVKAELLALGASGVDVILADFADLKEVRCAATEILAAYPRLDLVVNSAGLHSTRRILTPEGHELVFCVNHLASFLLTALLLPRFKENPQARIIQVNSEGHRFGGLDLGDLSWERRHYTGLRGYGASKVAQLLCTWEFADLLGGGGATINAMHPGDLRTNIGANNGPLYRWFLHNVTWHFLREPAMAGEAIHYLAAASELGGTTGLFFHLTTPETPTKAALDREAGKRVWERTLELVGLPRDYRP